MELILFLQRLLDFGLKEKYFEIKSIKDLAKTCCPSSQTKVIDFDVTAEKIVSDFKQETGKSCDALKIIPDLNRIDFIELKSIENFIKYQKPVLSDIKIDKQIEKFHLIGKILNSIHVLGILVGSSKFKPSPQERLLYANVSMNLIVLVDLDIEKDGLINRMVTLDFLSKTSTPLQHQIAYKLNMELDKLLVEQPLKNLKKPVLISCNRIDQYYDELSK